MKAPPAESRPIAPPPKPFQFGVRDVALVMLLVGLLLAAMVQLNSWLLLGFEVTLVACLAIAWKVEAPRAYAFIGVLLCLQFLATLLLPAVTTPRAVARRSSCQFNLKHIAIALHNYHDTYDSFPPAYIADEQGRPMHSWRVLLLPYLDQRALYKQYRFDEPWDGPNNRKLATEIMRVYSCPSDHDGQGSLETSYVAVVGPGTAWPGEKASKFSDFKDGMSNVLLIAEVHHSGIHWIEPRDLHISQMATSINPKSGQGISSMHPNGAQAAFADGSIHFLTDKTPADSLRSLIFVDDGTQWPPD